MNLFGKPTQSVVLCLGVLALFFSATESFEDEPTKNAATTLLQNYNGQHDSNLSLIYRNQ